MNDGGELVFVYGTLRSGASNHFRMRGAKRIGEAIVRGRLYRIDWYPGLLLDEAAGEVLGEVYEVSSALMADLDEFEGIRGAVQDEYARVRGVAKAEGKEVELWVYEYRGDLEGCRLVEGGDWLVEE